MRGTRASLRGALALAAALWLALPAAAEVQRIEEVGAAPVRARSGGASAARDAALQEGLRSAVERVARGFLTDAEGGGQDPQAVDLAKVLGKRMVPYTTRFRVLEDRGERPATSGGARGGREYEVLVEAYVDADRVKQRLVDAGLLARDPLAAQRSRIEIELQGVDDYAALSAFRSLLVDGIGAASVVPQRFERGTAVLAVELPGRATDTSRLAERLAARGAPTLGLRALEVEPARLVLAVTWQPPEGDPRVR